MSAKSTVSAKQFLERKNIAYTEVDGQFIVEGDIKIEKADLVRGKLPNLSMVEVRGDFICNNHDLQDLEGSPRVVGGNFYCFNNQLSDLEGGPHTVGGDFYCSYNRLKSLVDAPRTVGGDFYCDNNDLRSLGGAPQTVGKGFYCDNNDLKSLMHAPPHIGGDFYCDNNKLISLEHAPQEIHGDFYCSYNRLETLEGGPRIVDGDFYCDHNKLVKLNGAPHTVSRGFYCDHNKLISLVALLSCIVRGEIDARHNADLGPFSITFSPSQGMVDTMLENWVDSVLLVTEFKARLDIEDAEGVLQTARRQWLKTVGNDQLRTEEATQALAEAYTTVKPNINIRQASFLAHDDARAMRNGMSGAGIVSDEAV